MVATRIVRAPPTRLLRYGRRRFLRIVPAYWLALTVLTAATGLSGVFTSNWWVYYGLLQNYPVYTPTPECQRPLGALGCGISPTWSVALEVLFYIVLPFFAFGMALLASRARTNRWLVWELGVLGLFSGISVMIQAGVGSGSGDIYRWLFFSPIGRRWWLALGMGLAAISVWVQERGRDPNVVRWISEYPIVPWVAAATLYLGSPSLFVLDPGTSVNGPLGSRGQYVFKYIFAGVIPALVMLPAIFGDGSSGLPRRVLRQPEPCVAWPCLVRDIPLALSDCS